MKFIHCADIHLDAPFSSVTNSEEALRKRRELRADFASLMLYAKTNGCEMCFISGDLFDDSNITKDTYEMLYREMESFENCKFFISPGNHDPYHEKSPYALMKLPENVHIFTENKLEYVDIENTDIRVYGYAFTSETMTVSPLEDFTVEDKNKVNILVAHADVCSGYSNYCPFYESDMAKSGFDYIALGHIHKASNLKYAGNTPYAYPGSLSPRGFDETGYKGAIIGEISKNELCTNTVKIAKKRYEIVKCDMTGLENIVQGSDRIISMAASFGEDTALRIVLEGLTGEEFSLDEEYLRSIVKTPYYLEIKDETLPLFNVDRLKNDATIVGEFYRNIEPHLSSEDLKEREVARLALKLGLKALYGREI